MRKTQKQDKVKIPTAQVADAENSFWRQAYTGKIAVRAITPRSGLGNGPSCSYILICRDGPGS